MFSCTARPRDRTSGRLPVNFSIFPTRIWNTRAHHDYEICHPVLTKGAFVKMNYSGGHSLPLLERYISNWSGERYGSVRFNYVLYTHM